MDDGLSTDGVRLRALTLAKSCSLMALATSSAARKPTVVYSRYYDCSTAMTRAKDIITSQALALMCKAQRTRTRATSPARTRGSRSSAIKQSAALSPNMSWADTNSSCDPTTQAMVAIHSPLPRPSRSLLYRSVYIWLQSRSLHSPVLSGNARLRWVT